MKKEERDYYNKKIKLYEMLGAEKFQKIVLKVEELKFKIIKKFFPNFIDSYDRYCDTEEEKQLSKATTEEERKKIRKEFKMLKLAMRKEMNQEKNRNYHMDSNRPTEIIKYLEWNKEVHKGGLIKDLIIAAILVVGVVAGFEWVIPILVISLLNAAINFECVNIQNCSICKYKRCERALEKKEMKTTMKNIDEYGEASEVIAKAIEESEKLPKFSEIIDMCDSPEQLEAMRKMLITEQESRNKQKVRGNI